MEARRAAELHWLAGSPRVVLGGVVEDGNRPPAPARPGRPRRGPVTAARISPCRPAPPKPPFRPPGAPRRRGRAAARCASRSRRASRGPADPVPSCRPAGPAWPACRPPAATLRGSCAGRPARATAAWQRCSLGGGGGGAPRGRRRTGQVERGGGGGVRHHSLCGPGPSRCCLASVPIRPANSHRLLRRCAPPPPPSNLLASSNALPLLTQPWRISVKAAVLLPWQEIRSWLARPLSAREFAAGPTAVHADQVRHGPQTGGMRLEDVARAADSRGRARCPASHGIAAPAKAGKVFAVPDAFPIFSGNAGSLDAALPRPVRGPFLFALRAPFLASPGPAARPFFRRPDACARGTFRAPSIL